MRAVRIETSPFQILSLVEFESMHVIFGEYMGKGMIIVGETEE